jgi:hypothetical protein
MKSGRTGDKTMSNFQSLKDRAKKELNMELFRDRVTLNAGVMTYHLRKDKRSAAWPHFKTLDEVEMYLDECRNND